VDFLLLVGRYCPDFPVGRIAAAGAWPAFEIEPVEGGVIGYTATKYAGLGPIRTHAGFTLVLGDPLFDWVTASQLPSGRTSQIAGRLDLESLADVAYQPFHPAAILRCRPPETRARGILAEIRNDAMGAVPIFVAEGRAFVAVSSSPDLIALVTGNPLDLIACREFVSQAKVSFPYTLYKGVHELPPGSLLTLRTRSTRVSVSHRIPAPTTLGSSIRRVADASEASALVGAQMLEFFRRLGANLGDRVQIGCTLSAGLDSRTVLAAAHRAFPGRMTAVTGSPDDNPEVWTAREVAARLGVKAQTALWDPSVLIERFRTGNGLLFGSHRRWTDAHFQGASRLFDQSVVLGGYFSDAMMDANDGQIAMRRSAIERGTVPIDSHWSVLSGNFLHLDPASRRRIIRRATASLRQLNPRLAGVAHLRFSVPAGRALYAAHWMAMSREWGQYEPFLTEGALDIAVACASLRGPGLKQAMFSRILAENNLDDIPVNPETPRGGRSRAWLSFPSVLAATPDFAVPFADMRASVLSLLDMEQSAVYRKNLLVNVFWAHHLVEEWAAPSTVRRIRGPRGVARCPRQRPAS
jgi:hypothetical protein